MSRRPIKPRSPVIPVTLGGEPWTVKYRRMPKNWGLADFGRKRVTLDPRLHDSEYVAKHPDEDGPRTPREIAIHEALHVIFPQVDEEVIRAAGKEIDAYLDDLSM
jgi:hypothetical protein